MTRFSFQARTCSARLPASRLKTEDHYCRLANKIVARVQKYVLSFVKEGGGDQK
jgi:hypothetical protein